jgi:hypothetical protein
MKPRVQENLGDDWDEWLEIADKEFEKDPIATQELEGMREAVNSKTPIKEDKLFQLLYEMDFPLSCSGLLWADNDGTVIHGRNMDYAFHFNYTNKTTGETRVMNWPDVTYEVLFKKGGKPLFISTAWPGDVGVSTAMRFNGWTFEQQTRLGLNNAKENLKAAKKGGRSFGLVARRLMETIGDFEKASSALYGSKFMAPQYFIMAGSKPYEGTVLTIDRLGKHEDSTPEPARLAEHPGTAWHIVQTNDDLDKNALDYRRPIEERLLADMHQDAVDVDHMWGSIHSFPLKNPFTVYTAVMVPATGYYETILPTDEVPVSSNAASAMQRAEALNSHVKLKPSLMASSRPDHPRRKRQLRVRGLHKDSEEDDAAFMQLSLERPDLLRDEL